MSLNCLTCQNLPRVDSENELNDRCGSVDKPHFTLRRLKEVDRSWSGNLTPPRPPYDKKRNHESGMPGKAAKSGHHRLHGSGPIGYDSGPKLLRSSGMRRDWSFEDLRQRMDEQMKVHGH